MLVFLLVLKIRVSLNVLFERAEVQWPASPGARLSFWRAHFDGLGTNKALPTSPPQRDFQRHCYPELGSHPSETAKALPLGCALASGLSLFAEKKNSEIVTLSSEPAEQI